MKNKVDNKSKSVDAKLHKLKKVKIDKGKTKEKKNGPALAAVTPHTFAEKKVLAVKKKNQKQKLVESVKTGMPIVSQKRKDLKVKQLEKDSENVPVSKPEEATSELIKKKKKTKKSKQKDTQEKIEVKETLVSENIIISALKACKKTVDAGLDQKKNLFGEDLKYGLQIAAIKIPDVPSRNCRVLLPHPIYHKGDDICLIVKDLERGRKQDYEQTLNFWNDKLRELGIEYITQVIPFCQLKQDYKEYEMKLKLLHRFDRFLVDARINGHVFNFLGNNFIRKCKNPTPVILDKDVKIVKSIEKALSRVTYKQTNSGRVTEIQFTTHKMPLEKSVENATALLDALKSQYPGGWQNMRTIYLKPMAEIKISIPLFVSKIDPNSVPVPKVTGPRERFEKKMNEQLLEATKSKYKFQAGDLVRVSFDKRELPQREKLGNKKDKPVTRPVSDNNEPEANSDEEMEVDMNEASDTEQSDLGDSDDGN